MFPPSGCFQALTDLPSISTICGCFFFNYSLPTGLLGALQTDENYYGHGYGSLVVKYLSKVIAEMDHGVYAGIFEQNTASRSLFSKLGFTSIGEVHWTTTKITWSPADE